MLKKILLAAAATVAVGAASNANAALYLNVYFDGSLIHTETTTSGGISYMFANNGGAADGYLSSFSFDWLFGAPTVVDPEFDVTSQAVTSSGFTGSHTLRVIATQTDASVLKPLASSVTLNAKNGGAVSAQGFVDAGNGIGAAGEVTALSSPLSIGAGTGATSFNFNSPAAAASPYSQTIQIDYALNGASKTQTVSYQISGVPEAGTWMMMVAGFGLMGAAMRRRPRSQVTFA